MFAVIHYAQDLRKIRLREEFVHQNELVEMTLDSLVDSFKKLKELDATVHFKVNNEVYIKMIQSHFQSIFLNHDNIRLSRNYRSLDLHTSTNDGKISSKETKYAELV